MKIHTFLYILFFFLSTGVYSQLVFQSIEQDYGKVDRAKSLLSEFVVTNTGTEDAVILRIDAGPEFAFKLDQIIIKPGKSDTIRLFLKPTSAGRFDEKVSVFLSSQDKPVILRIKGELGKLDRDPLAQCFSFRQNHPDAYAALQITEQWIEVKNSRNGKPITEAFVQLFNSGNRSYYEYTKNEQGLKMNLRPDLYEIHVRADYYKSYRAEHYLAKDSRIIIELTPTEDDTGTTSIYVSGEKLGNQSIQIQPKDTSPPVMVPSVEVIKKDTQSNVDIKKDTIPELLDGKLNPNLFAPSNIVFLIDLSSSMNESGKLNVLKKSMQTLLNTLRPEDKLGIVVYAENARVLLQPVSVTNKDSIYTLIEKLKASGLTAANRGLRMAYLLNDSNYISEGNNQVILATDGMFSLSLKDEEMIRNYAGKRNTIKLSIVAFGNSESAQNRLKNMAGKGKGNYIDMHGSTTSEHALLNEIKLNSRR